jgi:type IX secretion system PorP/SprF family membrane protein
MKKKYFYSIILTISILLIAKNKSSAQQDAYFSQYMFNTLIINPAYAGSKNTFSSVLYHKQQWNNFDGAPTSQSFSVQGPFDYNRIGLGLNIQNEYAYATHTLNASLNYAYKINFHKGILSFGLYGGLKQFDFNPNRLLIQDLDDPLLQGKTSGISPDFGSGIYYSSKKYYTGFSATHLLQTEIKDIYKLRRHYYWTGAAKYKLSEAFTLIPSFLIKMTEASILQIDVTSHLKYKNICWAGISYRNPESFSIQSGISLYDILPTLNKKVFIGYAYDFFARGLAQSIGNTHEIMLQMDFKISDKINKLEQKRTSVSPLFF